MEKARQYSALREEVSGIIYVLTNQSMPGLVKLGMTHSSVEQRMKELDTTGIPLPFECFAAWEVSDAKGAERAIHLAFGDHRLRERREFFRISPDKPTAILRAFGLKDVTPGDDIVDDADDLRALERARSRRPRFSFQMIGVPIGAVLTSVFNDDVECVVQENDRVLFRGEVQSLSQSALAVAHETGRSWKAVAGPDYWKFEDVTLTELRNEGETLDD